MAQGRRADRSPERARARQARASPQGRQPLTAFGSARARILLGGEAGDLHDEARAWAAGLAAGIAADFDTARSILTPLATSASDPEVRVASRLSLGSVLRQCAQHAEAEHLDTAALEAAPDEAYRTDALIGLAADAVGQAAPDRCAKHLRAAALAMPVHDRRLAVRLGWVRTEHALLEGRHRDAVHHARLTVHEARATGSRRHIAKSMLFLGAALDATGDPEADRWLADAEREARAAGAISVAEAAWGLAARRRGEGGAPPVPLRSPPRLP